MGAIVIDAGYRKRGVQTTVIFSVAELVATDANRFFNNAVPWIAGDVKISQDGGAVANVTNLPTRIGTTPLYTITLTAAEMGANTIDVYLVDANGPAWGDTLIQIKTLVEIGRVQIDATGVGGNAHALELTGVGSGNAVLGTGGGTGDAAVFSGLSGLHLIGTSIAGLEAEGPSGAALEGSVTACLTLVGSGAATAGIDVTPGVSGVGIISRGGATSGDAAQFTAVGAGDGLQLTGVGANAGLRATASGVGSSAGVIIQGLGSGAGVSITAGATGDGVNIRGGSSSGDGVDIAAQAGDGIGLRIAGEGLGEAIQAQGGNTANGVQFLSGASGGIGLRLSGISGPGLSVFSGAAEAARFVAGAGGTGISITATTGAVMTMDGATGISLTTTDPGAAGIEITAPGAAAQGVVITTGVVGVNITATQGGSRAVDLASDGSAIRAASTSGVGLDLQAGTVGASIVGVTQGMQITGAEGLDILANGPNLAGVDIHGAGTGPGVRTASSGGPGMSIEGVATAGLQILTTDGPGVDIRGGTDDPGIFVEGSGPSAGIQVTGGVDGVGVRVTAGGNGVAGLLVEASDGSAVGALFSSPAGTGISVTGLLGISAVGTTNHGISATGGGLTGHGIFGQSAGSGNGAQFTATAGGKGVGITGQAAGVGLDIAGGATGVGLRVTAAGADAAQFTSTGGNGDGIQATGQGTGFGGRFIGGSSDQGDIEGILDDSVLNTGIATAGDATHVTLSAAASGLDDYYTGGTVMLIGGTGAGQAQAITGYVGATREATVNGWVTAPAGGTQYVVLPGSSSGGGGGLTAAQVWDHLEGAEPTSAISSNASMREIMQFLKRFHFNRVDATNNFIRMFRDDSITTLQTSVRSFNKITARRAKYT